MRQIIECILNTIQPLAVIVFIVSGICALLLGYHKQGVVNLSVALANFFVFYGDKIFKH